MREVECNLIELDIMPDHLHLLVECDPHFVATVGGAPWEIVNQYVENQPTM